jgi:hypothetical protein
VLKEVKRSDLRRMRYYATNYLSILFLWPHSISTEGQEREVFCFKALFSTKFVKRVCCLESNCSQKLVCVIPQFCFLLFEIVSEQWYLRKSYFRKPVRSYVKCMCKFINQFGVTRKQRGNDSIWLEFLNLFMNLQFKNTHG